MDEYLWLLYSLAAVLAWGLWAFMPKMALRTMGANAVFVVEALGAVTVGAVVLVLAPKGFHLLGALCAFGAGIAGYLGILIFIRLVDKQHVGTAAATTALYPVITVILSTVFLHERLSPRQLAGVGLALAAVFLINLPPRQSRDSKQTVESPPPNPPQ